MTSRLLVALRVRSTPSRAFDAFTNEIDHWWRPNGLFQFTPGEGGRLAFEAGPNGRLTQTTGNEVFEIGRILVWDPPARLSFSWRQASFCPGQLTEVHVRFEPVGDETRVTVEHIGWDSVPQDHAARHGLPLSVFQRRHADWWRTLLGALEQRVERPSGRVAPGGAQGSVRPTEASPPPV